MRRWSAFPVALVAVMLPAFALGISDGKPDSYGIYFDAGGNIMYTTEPIFVPFDVYLMLANPVGPVDGFECTVSRVGAPSFLLSTDLGIGAVDADTSENGFAVTATTSYPVINQAIVLAHMQYLVLSYNPLDFYIGPATTPTLAGGLPIVTGGGVPRQCGISVCDFNAPVAIVNGGAPFDSPCSGGPSYNPYVQITASAGGLQDQPITATTRDGATAGFDVGYDYPRPAPPPGNYVMASFEHGDWALGPRFRRDCREREFLDWRYKIWPVLVESTMSGDVTLTFWTDGGPYVYLHDLQTDDMILVSTLPEPDVAFSGFPGSARFELIIGDVTDLPELSPANRALPVGWSMIGLPLVPQVGSTVLSLLDYPAAGAQIVNDFNNATGYHQLTPTTMVHEGIGYWLATTEAYDWTMPGVRDLDGTTVPLANGWNLVGCANWFPGLVDGLRVVQDGTSYPWTTAAQMGLVSADLQTYDPASGAYVATGTLQPWYGYWVNALQDGLSLFFQWENFLAAAKSAAPSPVIAAANAAEWQATLTLTDAVGAERAVVFGRQAGATDGFDALYDQPLPPPSPAGGPQLMIRHPEWGLAAGAAFARDLIGLEAENAVWPVVVSSPSPGPATLQWSPEAWPEGTDGQLYLPQEGRVVVASMRSQTSYPLMLGGAAIAFEVRERTYVSGVEVPADVAYRLTASPNPFNPQTTLRFALPAAGRAEVRIYSLRGELTAVLGGASYAAGLHEETWHGTDRHGREVPSGAYFARLVVDGMPRGAVARLSLVR